MDGQIRLLEVAKFSSRRSLLLPGPLHRHLARGVLLALDGVDRLHLVLPSNPFLCRHPPEQIDLGPDSFPGSRMYGSDLRSAARTARRPTSAVGFYACPGGGFSHSEVQMGLAVPIDPISTSASEILVIVTSAPSGTSHQCDASRQRARHPYRSIRISHFRAGFPFGGGAAARPRLSQLPDRAADDRAQYQQRPHDEPPRVHAPAPRLPVSMPDHRKPGRVLSSGRDTDPPQTAANVGARPAEVIEQARRSHPPPPGRRPAQPGVAGRVRRWGGGAVAGTPCQPDDGLTSSRRGRGRWRRAGGGCQDVAMKSHHSRARSTPSSASPLTANAITPRIVPRIPRFGGSGRSPPVRLKYGVGRTVPAPDLG